MKKEFAVVLPVDLLEVGTHFDPYVPLPLHCTLMRWFKVTDEGMLDMAINQIGQLAMSVPSEGIQLLSGELQYFGANLDVPVRIVEDNEILNVLHMRMLSTLRDVGVQVKHPEWSGIGYRPHVRTIGDNLFPRGTTYFAKTMTVVSRGERRQKEVIREFVFGSSVLRG